METELIKPQFSGKLYEDKLYEYLLVIAPDETVFDKVMQEKQLFFDIYNEQSAIKTKPHITVANFMAHEAMEDTLIRYLHRIFSIEKSFAITLNNYSGFPPHTVYLRVQDHKPFKQLTEKLQPVAQYIKANTLLPMKLITRPHVTIARSLAERVYDKAMLDFSQRVFNETFIAKELLLLRRTHQFDACRQVNIFRFS